MPGGSQPVPNKLVLLTCESWADLYRAIDGLTPEEAMTRSHGSSAIAWTLGHVTHMVDSWINVRFQRLPPHPVIDTPGFRAGGGGEALDWPTVLAAAGEVRDAAKPFLDTVDEADLDRVIPYDGSIALLRDTGLRLGYALMRITAHHYIHVREIVTVRSRLGHATGQTELPDWGRALL